MIQSPVEKKLVPISQAARILGVSIDTIRRWDKSGKLHSERLNGKDRYFFLEDLEEIKFAKSLSISEAAMQLKISPATLRRLEKKGLISPKRTQSGERTYDGDAIRKFLESEYFARKMKTKEGVKEIIKGKAFESEDQHSEREESIGSVENHLPEASPESSEKTSLYKNLKPLQRLPEVLIATVVFFLLVTFGIRSVMISTAKTPHSPTPFAFLLATEETKPNPPILSTTANTSNPSTFSAVLSATEAAKPKMMLTVKVSDGGASVNIRQKPTTNSEKIGQARDGDAFEFVSENSEWYEVKLATMSGFISAKYIEVGEGINE